MSVRRSIAFFALAALLTGVARAQTHIVPLWPGPAPGSESWTQRERTISDTPIGTVVLNVVKPTLTLYLPDPKKATGTGIIVAPGGSCVALAIGREGYDVARWLQAHGIAAFVLKYRVIEKKQEGIPTDLDMDAACKYGVADAVRAIAIVRAHAAQWHVRPNRIGIVGFSAGGMVASEAALAPDAWARPDFAGLIYGTPFGMMPPIPKNVPR